MDTGYHPGVDEMISVMCPDPACGLDFEVDHGLAWRRISCPTCGAEGAAILADVRRRLRAGNPGAAMPQMLENSVAVVLEDLRSVHNVGSILRTCDAFGIDLVVMTGITATPEHPKIARTALGAELEVPWVWRGDGPSAVAEFQDLGIDVIALERTDEAVPIADMTVNGPFALVIGNEVAGVSGPVLAKASRHAAIPMLGSKSSLNAAVACAVALWQLRSRP
jgi:tRNA G18 (ribose-2'-O)-methylase SpoU